MMSSPRENPIVVLGFFLALALLAWLTVYVYNYIYLPRERQSESEAADATFQASDPPIRVAYQPMPWPELEPSGKRVELQAHIQPYDNDNTDLICERMPQVKDVINLVLSQFDDEQVALGLDLAVVEEQLTNAINQRLGEPVIRGTFIDVGTTSGTYERYRLYCAASGKRISESASTGASRNLDNWFVRAAKSRQRRAERVNRMERLEKFSLE